MEKKVFIRILVQDKSLEEAEKKEKCCQGNLIKYGFTYIRTHSLFRFFHNGQRTWFLCRTISFLNVLNNSVILYVCFWIPSY